MPGARIPRGVSVKGKAEIVEGSRVRYTCPQGHVQTEDMNRKSLPISKRVSPAGVRLLARYWGNPKHAGVTYVCKKCTLDAQ
jgi:hypothetical protein